MTRSLVFAAFVAQMLIILQDLGLGLFEQRRRDSDASSSDSSSSSSSLSSSSSDEDGEDATSSSSARLTSGEEEDSHGRSDTEPDLFDVLLGLPPGVPAALARPVRPLPRRRGQEGQPQRALISVISSSTADGAPSTDT
ncbi:hypothetical protein EXIGLDRAFT_293982 [Exidia glandulosa HHB12029]|uniref:Uncharacterized protein n=1 Tax=Exidia glandulosa HHB12029 TaxID=1314781 RepID=A0A165DDN8_EXIGL|nr:hypothetical protein EXIGLDRAFT_293982 [Exidia glandulosa HHB12029]